MNGKNKHIVMLGVGDDNKGRACRFDVGQEPAVRKAAGMMNSFRVGTTKTEQAATLAAKLSEGKYLAGGLVTAAIVADDLFYKLAKFLTFDETWNTAGIIAGSPASSDSDTQKAAAAVSAALKPGSTVLVFENMDALQFGWSAAVVTAIKNDILSLRWRDWPGVKSFTANRNAVALLPTGAGK